MFYFSRIFFMMVYSVEQNTFIVVFYFRNGNFINGELSAISKGKSSGRPPVSDEIVEDLKKTVEKPRQKSIACLSQQSGVP
jgi:hypothetical protein